MKKKFDLKESSDPPNKHGASIHTVDWLAMDLKRLADFAKKPMKDICHSKSLLHELKILGKEVAEYAEAIEKDPNLY